MKRFRMVLFTLAVPVAGLALASQWLPQLFTDAPARLVYDSQELQKGSIRKLVSTSGPVRALVTVQVGSQLSGQIVELKVDFNSEVKSGDVLAVLDAKSFVSRVAQARADLAAAKAALLNSEASIQKAEAVARQAERNAERQRQLASRGVSAQAALDTATRDIEVARAELAVAKAQVESAKATVQQRDAQLEQAQIDLDRTQIRSPINGTVISRTVDIGQTVAASLQAPELFKIAQDLRRIRIEAQVNEADVGAVHEGNAVEFSVDAYPERKFAGRVTQVRLAATELQNVVTYTVIIEAENDDRRLYPGMTANVLIESARVDNVLRIANDALRFKPRDRKAETAAAPSAQQRAERSERMLERLKDEMQLTDAQAEAVKLAMRKAFQEMQAERQAQSAQQKAGPTFAGAPPQQSADPAAGARARISAEIERVLRPLLSEAQVPLFERWKRGRENTRNGTVWVLKSDGDIESRQVRLGIADDQFTELIGGPLKAGERVVARARDAAKK